MHVHITISFLYILFLNLTFCILLSMSAELLTSPSISQVPLSSWQLVSFFLCRRPTLLCCLLSLLLSPFTHPLYVVVSPVLCCLLIQHQWLHHLLLLSCQGSLQSITFSPHICPRKKPALMLIPAVRTGCILNTFYRQWIVERGSVWL